jgi:predicted transcriptional regulator
MSIYALIENSVVTKYPYSPTDLRKDQKNISLPKIITDNIMKSFGAEIVYFTSPPEATWLQVVKEVTPEFISDHWEQAWEVVDKYQDYTDEEGVLHTKAEQEAQALQDFIESRCKEVDALNDQKLYTNATVMFPDGEKIIQFRNEKDRADLSNVSSAAMALIMSGTPESPLGYRTEDNVTQIVRADQMVGIAMGVLQMKQDIKTVSWSHKDALRQLTDYQDVVDYDINQGW